MSTASLHQTTTPPKRSRRWLRILLIAIPIILIIAIAGFVFWANTASQPMPEALVALTSDSAVQVSDENGWAVFTPTNLTPGTGFIFYPGGRVDYRAYAPMAHDLAADGYLTIITPMPLNLAILDIDAADAVISAHPEIEQWVIGGHSLGGSMAARYVLNHPDAMDGLVFLAAYSDMDISNFDVSVTSISASLDGLATPDKITAGAPLLPADTVYVEIAGGDHAQFGWYGDQAGDNPATITRDDQQAQTLAAIESLLVRIDQ